MPITVRVQNHSGDKAVQPSSNSSVKAEGTRLRRRLSKSFHSESAESGFFWRCPLEPGTRGSSHGTSCQSPRIQRWRRLTSALYRDGYSSYNCTSLNSPDRA